MQKLILVSYIALCSQEAFANCPAADALIAKYGISFSGFEKAIPRLSNQPKITGRPEDIAQIILRDEKDNVKDGFQHVAVINKAAKQAWLLRTGGFAGVYEWYGPVPVENTELTGCLIEGNSLN